MRELSSKSSSSSFLLVVPLVLVTVFVLIFDPRISGFPSLSLSNSYSNHSLDLHSKPAGAHEGLHSVFTDAKPVADSLELQAELAGAHEANHFVSSDAKVVTNKTILHPQRELNCSEKLDNKLPRTENAQRSVSKLEKLEADLTRARKAIREAALRRNTNQTSRGDVDYVPYGPIYRNPFAFHRSYLEMEKLFKIFVYEEGQPPLVHDGPCRSIYSSEGLFIHEMERGNMEMERGNMFRTKDPEEAQAHFLPFSVAKMISFIYKSNSFDLDPVKRFVIDYVEVIARKYPYWNRSLGADHFMVSCHDWGPHTSAAVPHLYNNSIRVLCNANTSEGFKPYKDASLPEINLRSNDIAKLLGGPSPSRRPILAFFAGRNHGPIRPALINHWNNKDEDIHVSQYLPKNISYHDEMRKSKFCLCPSGYEVASPRIVEAIYTECVPVIISDNYVLPFSDVLNWRSFSVQITVDEVPNLKEILMGISQRRYIKMQRRVKQVQRHFVVNQPAKRFDVFHMILHSVWLRRLNIHLAD